MKQIYIVLTSTGAIPSKIIKTFTHDEYSHSSLAFDKQLNQMYGFGRLNPYFIFPGGFVNEHIDKGTFKRFKDTKARIIEFNINDDQYDNLKNNVIKMEEERGKYKYSILGVIACYFNKKYKREYYYYCSEFIYDMFLKAGIDFNLPEILKPEHFKENVNGKTIYEGLLREYR